MRNKWDKMAEVKEYRKMAKNNLQKNLQIQN